MEQLFACQQKLRCMFQLAKANQMMLASVGGTDYVDQLDLSLPLISPSYSLNTTNLSPLARTPQKSSASGEKSSPTLLLRSPPIPESSKSHPLTYASRPASRDSPMANLNPSSRSLPAADRVSSSRGSPLTSLYSSSRGSSAVAPADDRISSSKSSPLPQIPQRMPSPSSPSAQCHHLSRTLVPLTMSELVSTSSSVQLKVSHTHSTQPQMCLSHTYSTQPQTRLSHTHYAQPHPPIQNLSHTHSHAMQLQY